KRARRSHPGVDALPACGVVATQRRVSANRPCGGCCTRPRHAATRSSRSTLTMSICPTNVPCHEPVGCTKGCARARVRAQRARAKRLPGRWDCSELLHQAEHVGDEPVLGDLAIDDAVHFHRGEAHLLAGRRNPHKLAAMGAAKPYPGRDLVLIGDHLLNGQMQVGERGGEPPDELLLACIVEWREAGRMRDVVRGAHPFLVSRVPFVVRLDPSSLDGRVLCCGHWYLPSVCRAQPALGPNCRIRPSVSMSMRLCCSLPSPMRSSTAPDTAPRSPVAGLPMNGS